MLLVELEAKGRRNPLPPAPQVPAMPALTECSWKVAHRGTGSSQHPMSLRAEWGGQGSKTKDQHIHQAKA